MEVKSVSLDRSSNVLLQSQLVLQDIQAKQAALDSKMNASKLLDAQKVIELGLYDSQNEDEGEIMLFAMILLQLHGVKMPNNPLNSSDEDVLNKKKRQRTSPDQLAILEQIFQTDKMPNQQTRVHLADKLGMSSRRVQIWFQNKRAKVKRGSGKDGEFDDSPVSSRRRDSVSSELSDEPQSPSDSTPSSLSSSSSEVPLTSSLPNLPSTNIPFVSSSSTTSPTPMPIAVSTAVAQIPFKFSPPPKQFSLTSFEPKSNILPDFASPRMSVVAQST